MHLFVCYHRFMHPHTVYTFILRFSVRPFSGLVEEAGSPSVNFTPALWHGWHLPTALFCFARCIPTPCTFGKKLVNSALLLRVLRLIFSVWRFRRGLRSQEKIFWSWFWRLPKGRSEDVGDFFYRCRASWLSLSFPISWGVSALVTGFLITETQRFLIFLGGFQSSLKDWSATASNILVILLPSFCLYRIAVANILTFWSPSLWQYF